MTDLFLSTHILRHKFSTSGAVSKVVQQKHQTQLKSGQGSDNRKRFSGEKKKGGNGPQKCALKAEKRPAPPKRKFLSCIQRKALASRQKVTNGFVVRQREDRCDSSTARTPRPKSDRNRCVCYACEEQTVRVTFRVVVIHPTAFHP